MLARLPKCTGYMPRRAPGPTPSPSSSSASPPLASSAFFAASVSSMFFSLASSESGTWVGDEHTAG